MAQNQGCQTGAKQRSLTINLLTVVPSGMVLLADSMLTLRQESGPTTITTFDSAEKLIALCREPFPAAALISGPGNVNRKLVSELLRSAGDAIDKQLDNDDEDAVDHEAVVSEIRSVLNAEWPAAMEASRCDAAQRESKRLSVHNATREARGLPPLAQIEPKHIAIPDADDNDPENAFIDWKITKLIVVVATHIDGAKVTVMSWPGSDVVMDLSSPREQMRWWGSGSTAVSRLVLGFDRQKLDLLREGGGRDKAGAALRRRADTMARYAEMARELFMMPVPLESLPLQAAIEFTEFLGMAACRYDEFSVGETTVGGPLDVLVLQPKRRHWVRKKEIHSTLGQQAGPC